MRKILIISFFMALVNVSLSFGKDYKFLVGTYTTNTGSKGIYKLTLKGNGTGADIKVASDQAQDPSYLAFSKDLKYVYAVGEKGYQSTVSAFSFDKKNGTLSKLNTVQAEGADPCFISINNGYIVTANYSSGSFSVFKQKNDGSVSDLIHLFEHKGKSINPERQGDPHVHQTLFSNDGKYLLVNDLGTDHITTYAFKPGNDLMFQTIDSVQVKPGSGPRHSTFNKRGNLLYVVHELDGTLSTFSFNQGKLQLLNETSIVRKEGIINGAADIHLSPDGKYLYATNRGTANDITVFAIDKNGIPVYRNQYPVAGEGPRNFAISADGKFLLVANQLSSQITVFKRNQKTGELTRSDLKIQIPAPVCLKEYK